MATEANIQDALRSLYHALGRHNVEPPAIMVSTWAKALRYVDGRLLGAAVEKLAQRIETMPSLGRVIAETKKVTGPLAEPTACSDCQYGIRAGFYRLTISDYDEHGNQVGTHLESAEVALACTCPAGERYSRTTSRWDEWRDRRAPLCRGPSDVVWVADRHERMPSWSRLYPDRPPPAPVPGVSAFAPAQLVGRGPETPRSPPPAVPESWYDERDYREERPL